MAEPSAAPADAEPLEEKRYGPVRVLFGARGGRYPDLNSILVEGERETALIDPALGVVRRHGEGTLPPIDRILISHCHEDHISGAHLFRELPLHVHELDKGGFESLDAMMATYGYGGAIDTAFRKAVVEQFNYLARPDALTYADGAVFDLGGVTVRAIHTPGHTRGHCCLEIAWQEEGTSRTMLYLSDIELTSFGPYYGDAQSNLLDFERSLAHVRELHADYYATAHHIGVLETRDAFLERLDRFEGMIGKREARLLEYLAEPHTLDEIARHRFVYRPTDDVGFAEPVERRSMEQHIERLIERGRVRALAGERFQAV